MIVLIASGGYWYYVVEAVCRVPISYSIGTIDPRFNLSYDEVRTAVSDAESMWEGATGRNLFTYDEVKGIPINYIYDDRQERTNTEQVLREELEEKQNLSEEVKDQYEDLSAQYDQLKAQYERQSDAYEVRLAAHNTEVARWNDGGGAPADVYEQLNIRQTELGKEQKDLNTIAYQLNLLVREINKLGDKGNVLVSAYNNVVETYNDNFEEEQEFTQGDYQGTAINIYQYTTPEELRLVLAHEFGHALSLGHVKDPAAIMFSLMEQQSLETGITADDGAEFDRVCGKSSFAPWAFW
jgi:hypothetical protein